MKVIITLLFTLISCLTFGQYAFEKYPAPLFKEYNNWKLYDWTTTKQTVHHTLSIDNFFDNKDTLTIQLTSFTSNLEKASEIRIFLNKVQLQKITEQMFFSTLNMGYEPIRVADINGDGLLDLKILVPYMGVGTAGFNVKVIYLFQTKNQKFIKVSFSDKMAENRLERDFNGGGNYEIITMNLVGYEKHSYWVFNIFEYEEEQLKNANYKYNYPIMIQFLYRNNYETTNKIPMGKMKDFTLGLPDDFEEKE